MLAALWTSGSPVLKAVVRSLEFGADFQTDLGFLVEVNADGDFWNDVVNAFANIAHDRV